MILVVFILALSGGSSLYNLVMYEVSQSFPNFHIIIHFYKFPCFQITNSSTFLLDFHPSWLDIPILFYTNEYLNFFCINKTIRKNIRIYSYKKQFGTNVRINIYIKSNTNIWILSFYHTLPEYDFDTNKNPNIFVSRKLYERISEYISIKKLIQTKTLNEYLWQILLEYIQIYSSHSDPQVNCYKFIGDGEGAEEDMFQLCASDEKACKCVN